MLQVQVSFLLLMTMIQISDGQSATLTMTDITSSTPPEGITKPDIEHAVVEDDPRLWSNTSKVGSFFRLSARLRLRLTS